MRGSTDVNIEQIKAGMAWWYREYAKEQTAEDRASYAAEEVKQARQFMEGCETRAAGFRRTKRRDLKPSEKSAAQDTPVICRTGA
jgi:hypothetical protein